jgi:ATP-binding cassette subfamily B protein
VWSLAQLAVLVQATLGMASLGSLEGDVWIDNGAIPIPSVLALEHELSTERTLRPAREPIRVRHAIRFSGVSFAYPRTSRPILDRFDLEISAGQSLAIVGANGAGKTTALKLLLRMYEPTAGDIRVDGTPLHELDLAAWRRGIAVIFQDFARYELSARDNIGFGATTLLETAGAEPAMQRAAARADAQTILESLPHGFDTVLSRRFAGGVELSGGEWQRIALARALFAIEAGANVLMLDEPTAHLDVRAEIEVFDRFLELTAGLTTIIVSHRFSTVRRADRIVVVANGRIVEHGSHAELVSNGGQYARMFHAQAAAYHA